MDEPTSGVSAQDKSKVMDTRVPVLKGTGVTTIFVEHDMEVVQRYAERVLAFDEGKVVAAGSPDAVLADPAVRRAPLGQPAHALRFQSPGPGRVGVRALPALPR